MKQNKKWALTAASAGALLFFFSAGLADNVSTCSNYLTNYSNSQFIHLVSSKRSTAASVAQALNACQLSNACATISGVDHCASLLATREFESNYFAHFSQASPIPAIKNPSKPNTSFKSAAVKLNTSAPDTSTPSDEQADQTKTTNKTESDIHWF